METKDSDFGVVIIDPARCLYLIPAEFQAEKEFLDRRSKTFGRYNKTESKYNKKEK